MLFWQAAKQARDGIHGVTFASAELTEKSEEITRPAVQIADPIEEEKVKRAIIEIRDRQLGLCNNRPRRRRIIFRCRRNRRKIRLRRNSRAWQSPVEVSGFSAMGNLRFRITGTNAYWQFHQKTWRRLWRFLSKKTLKPTQLAHLTPERRLHLKYQGETVADLDMEFLFNPCKSTKKATFEKPTLTEPDLPNPKTSQKPSCNCCRRPNIASKESVVRTYDHEVKGNTTLKPLQGEYAGPNDAAVIKPLDDSWKGLAISCGMNPNYGKIDAYWMAASAIDEAIRNNLAVGGRRIALLDNFTWGNPEKPERLGSLVRACEACYDVATAFRTPFISGKDSLYNESPLGPVTPTLLITAIGIVPDMRAAVSMDLKAPGNLLYIVGETYPELGGSEYYKLKGYLGEIRSQSARDQSQKNILQPHQSHRWRHHKILPWPLRRRLSSGGVGNGVCRRIRHGTWL